MKTKLLMLVNVDWFFISHRLPIALAALKKGYEVHLAFRFTGAQEDLKNLGFIIHEIPFISPKVSLIEEIKTFYTILRLLLRLRPNVIHAVTIKPSLYVGILARMLGIKNLIIAVSGLGQVFVAEGRFALWRKYVVGLLYKMAVDPKHTKLIFQNESDASIIQAITRANPRNINLIRGSGVDLAKYKYTEQPVAGKMIVSFAARLLKEKGIYEFIKAAEIISMSAYSDSISLRLIGAPDPENHNSISQEEWETWKRSGIVECLGFRSDINTLFSQTNIVVLPSYYGEGLPKVLIEAAACGRAIITTDCPGCRDSILDGETGVMIPVKDPVALANAILELAGNRLLVRKMGMAARKYAEKTFSIDSVVSLHIDIYERILNSGKYL